MKKLIFIRKIITVTFVLVFVINTFNIAFAVSPPSKIDAYFSDPSYNWEKITYTDDGKLDTTTKQYVYRVFYQQNRDGSAFINIFWVTHITYHLIPSEEKHYSGINCAITYGAGTFDVYVSSAPWQIYKCEKHITDGFKVTLDVSNDYPLQGEEPDPTNTPRPTSNNNTSSPDNTPTLTPKVTASPILTVEPTATPTAEPTATIAPTPTMTFTPAPISTPEDEATVSLLNQNLNLLNILLGLILLLLIVCLAWAIKKYNALRKEQERYFD